MSTEFTVNLPYYLGVQIGFGHTLPADHLPVRSHRLGMPWICCFHVLGTR